MITILGGLAWIWWAILGFLGFVLGVYGACKVLGESLGEGSLPNAKDRDRWLLAHFGEDGRRRWLANWRLMEEYNAWRSEKYAPASRGSRRLVAKARARLAVDPHAFDNARLGPDGEVVGMVDDQKSFFQYMIQPPWGVGLPCPYSEAHSGPYCHVSGNGSGKDQGVWRHGEPRGSDWLAAGFWSPVVRDDGVMVDPMSVLRSDMTSSWFDGGRPMDAVIAGGEALMAEARKEALASERPGHRTSIGLPRNGWKVSVMGA